MRFSSPAKINALRNRGNIIALFVWAFIVILFTYSWLLPNITQVNTINDNQIFFFNAWYFGEALREHLPILPIMYEFYPEGLKPFDEPLFLPHTFLSGLLSLIIPLEIGYNVLLLLWFFSFGIAQFYFLKMFAGKKYWPLALFSSFLILTPYSKEFLSGIPSWIPLVFTPISFIIAEKIVREKNPRYFIILSICLALYFISNPQYFYYNLLALVIFFAYSFRQIINLFKNNILIAASSVFLFLIFSASHLIFVNRVFSLGENNYALRIWQVLTPLECKFTTKENCVLFYDSHYYPFFLFVLLAFVIVGALFLNKNEKKRILPYVTILTFFAVYSSSVQFSLPMNKFLPFANLLNNPSRSFFIFLPFYPIPLIILIKNLKNKWFYGASALLISLSLFNIIISHSNTPTFRFEDLENLEDARMEPFYFLKDKPYGAIFVEEWPNWNPYLLLGGIVSEKPLVNGYADFKFSRDSHCAKNININNISQNCQEFYKKHNIRYYITFQELENKAAIIKKQNFTIIDILELSKNQKQ